MWKAIGACNYFPSKDSAKRQFDYAKGEELDYMSLHRLVCSWDNEEHAGTSFAAPVFAAMCALVQCFFIKNTGAKLNHEQLNKFIIDNCVDLEEDGKDHKTGYGLFILPDPETIEIEKYTDNKIVENEEETDNKNNDDNEEGKNEMAGLPKIEIVEEVRYKYLKDVPAGEFHDVIKALVDNNIIKGRTGNLKEETEVDLSEDMTRIFVILHRLGLFDSVLLDERIIDALNEYASAETKTEEE